VAFLNYHWLIFSFLNVCFATSKLTGFNAATNNHPFFISVTEVTHNSNERTFEISCKIFADDFEQALKQAYKIPVDFSGKANEAANNKLINAYIQKNLSVSIDATMKCTSIHWVRKGRRSGVCIF
jgi:hypothetical protein